MREVWMKCCSAEFHTIFVWLLYFIPSSSLFSTSAPNQMKAKERRSPGRSSRYDDYDRDGRRRRSRSRSYDRYRSRSPSSDHYRRRSESPREWVFSLFCFFCLFFFHWNEKKCRFNILTWCWIYLFSFFRSRGRVYGRGRSRSHEEERYSLVWFGGGSWSVMCLNTNTHVHCNSEKHVQHYS